MVVSFGVHTSCTSVSNVLYYYVFEIYSDALFIVKYASPNGTFRSLKKKLLGILIFYVHLLLSTFLMENLIICLHVLFSFFKFHFTVNFLVIIYCCFQVVTDRNFFHFRPKTKMPQKLTLRFRTKKKRK